MKNKNILLVMVSLFVLCSSCIPTRKMTYVRNLEDISANEQGVIQNYAPVYKLRTDDIIRVKIFGIDEEIGKLFGQQIGSQGTGFGVNEQSLYFDGLTVDLKGNVELPLLGVINVKGMSIEDSQKAIQARADKFFKPGAIYVNVKLAGINFTALGEINRQGIHTIYRNDVNVYEAFAIAGGVPVTGDLTHVKLLRKFPDGQRMYILDLTDSKLLTSPFYNVQPDDLFIVNPLPQKSWGVGTNTIGTIATAFTLITSTLYLIDRINRKN